MHWRQSLAATISLAAGLVSLVMFQGYMKDVQRIYQESFRSRMMWGDVVVENEALRKAEGRAEPWKFAITPPEQEFVKKFADQHSQEVDAYNRFLPISGVVTNGKATTIFRGYGYDLREGEKTRGHDWAWNAIYGAPLKDPHTALLGQSLGKILGCTADKKEKILNGGAGYKPVIRPYHCDQKDIQLNITTPEGMLNAVDLEVVGLVDALYKDIDDKFVTTSLEDAQTLMNTPNLGYITIKFLHEGDFIDRLIEEFNKGAQSSGLELRMQRWEDHIVGEMYVRTMKLLSTFRNFVVTVIVAIAGLSIFNTMMKLVKERTREIGTLRSLGFLPQQILFIFLSEAVTLSFIGGLIGSLVAALSTLALNSIGIAYKAGVLVEPVPFRIMISPMLYVFSFIFLSVLAAVTTWIVCRSSLKSSTAENLTYA
ncbi:MAG: ABC transporter permease [Pseudobdellovibrionaceae bacterium]